MSKLIQKILDEVKNQSLTPNSILADGLKSGLPDEIITGGDSFIANVIFVINRIGQFVGNIKDEHTCTMNFKQANDYFNNLTSVAKINLDNAKKGVKKNEAELLKSFADYISNPGFSFEIGNYGETFTKVYNNLFDNENLDLVTPERLVAKVLNIACQNMEGKGREADSRVFALLASCAVIKAAGQSLTDEESKKLSALEYKLGVYAYQMMQDNAFKIFNNDIFNEQVTRISQDILNSDDCKIADKDIVKKFFHDMALVSLLKSMSYDKSSCDVALDPTAKNPIVKINKDGFYEYLFDEFQEDGKVNLGEHYMNMDTEQLLKEIKSNPFDRNCLYSLFINVQSQMSGKPVINGEVDIPLSRKQAQLVVLLSTLELLNKIDFEDELINDTTKNAVKEKQEELDSIIFALANPVIQLINQIDVKENRSVKYLEDAQKIAKVLLNESVMQDDIANSIQDDIDLDNFQNNNLLLKDLDNVKNNQSSPVLPNNSQSDINKAKSTVVPLSDSTLSNKQDEINKAESYVKQISDPYQIADLRKGVYMALGVMQIGINKGKKTKKTKELATNIGSLRNDIISNPISIDETLNSEETKHTLALEIANKIINDPAAILVMEKGIREGKVSDAIIKDMLNNVGKNIKKETKEAKQYLANVKKQKKAKTQTTTSENKEDTVTLEQKDLVVLEPKNIQILEPINNNGENE